MKGHPYVKSPIDMACWDILGKVGQARPGQAGHAGQIDSKLCVLAFQVTKLPLSTLLGGRHQDSVIIYRAIPQRPPKEMAKLVLKYKSEVKPLSYLCIKID